MDRFGRRFTDKGAQSFADREAMFPRQGGFPLQEKREEGDAGEESVGFAGAPVSFGVLVLRQPAKGGGENVGGRPQEAGRGARGRFLSCFEDKSWEEGRNQQPENNMGDSYVFHMEWK